MSQASVIILNYNGVHFLEKFLPSVVQHSQGHQVVVADNGSTDDSIPFLQKHYPSVQLILFEQNYGFARGYNEALRHIQTPYSILLNSDVEVTPHWIEPVLEMMDNNPAIAACQPKVRSYAQKEYFEHAGAAGGYIDLVAYPFCRGRIFDVVEKDEGQYDDERPVFWATGACFFARTEVFRQMGGFDEIFHAHMEEIDLCWRMHAAGYQIFYQPKSLIYHVGGGTMPLTNPKKTYLNFRNSTGMLFKNTTFAQLLWRLPLKLLLDVVAALRFLLAGKPQDSRAVCRSIGSFFGQIGRWRRHRNRVQRIQKGKCTGIFPGILAVERYIKGKKYFSNLMF